MYVSNEEGDVAFTPEQLRTELDAAETRLLDARKKREDAEKHEKKLEAQRDAYRVLLGEAADASPSSVDPGSAAANSASKTNKTEVIRGIIREAGNRGATPVDIWKALKKSGTEMRRNYLYVTLNRLLEQGTIHKRGGRYCMEHVQ